MWLSRIVSFSVRKPGIALALTLLMGLGGFSALSQLPINSLPDVTPVQVLVITKAGRYSPFDVEKLVSYPIETAMNGLPKIQEVRSISQFGLSAVTVEFLEDTDIYFARQMVSQRLQSIRDELPEGVSAPQLGPISTALGELFQYVVRGPGYSLTELRTIQDWLIAPQLKTIKGVTEINSFGGFVKQYEILVNPGHLRTCQIGLNDLMEALSRNNGVSGGNYLVHNGEQYIVRGFGQIRSMDEIGRIIVARQGDRPVFLDDIADIREGQQLRQGGVTQDGQGEVVTGIVMMLRGGNGRLVIQDINAKIKEISAGLPQGVRIEKFYDQSDLVRKTTSTVSTNLMEGGFLVIAVLLFFLGEVRGALIVATVIPFSMLFAFIGMREFGLAANLMSLGAIDFGMVVDGSVVMVENVVHHLGSPEARGSIPQQIERAAQQVVRPIFFGVLIILMVYVPIMTFSGMEGILYRPMAITVAAAVLGSLILTLLFVPAAARLSFRRGVKTFKDPLLKRVIPPYRRLLARIIKHPGRTLGGALVLFLLSLLLIPFLGTEFLPELDEGSILIEQIRMPSITLDEAMIRADRLAGILKREIPEIETVVPKTGRSDLANDWMGVHQTDVWVLLKPRKSWRRGIDKGDIIHEIEPFLQKEPGLAYNFTQPIAMRVDELTSGVKSDVAVKLFGEELETLEKAAQSIAQVAQTLPGTANVFSESVSGGQPYITIHIDRHAAAAYGLNADQIQEVIEVGIGGSSAGQLFEGQRRFELVVRFPPAIRNHLDQIGEIPVSLPEKGGFIPLKRVARIEISEGPREIFRENGWRRTVVAINLRDIDIGTYVGRLEKAIADKVSLPEGVFLRFGGAFENQQRAMRHLLIVVPLALLLIIGLLYLMFDNLRHPLLIFLNLPLALSGGIVMLWLRGLTLSVSASIGFIALFGVAVLNGVVLVAHLNDLSGTHQGEGRSGLILQGAIDRLRPVLMTALVASLGFIPMAFNSGPGSEVQRPLASVVIGGLITSTLLTLLVLPTLYHWLEERRSRLS